MCATGGKLGDLVSHQDQRDGKWLALLCYVSLMNEFDKVLPVDQPALEEPHNDIVGQGDGVVVELEGVGVGKGDGEYREKLLCVKSFNTFERGMRMEPDICKMQAVPDYTCWSEDHLQNSLLLLAPSSCSSWPG